MYEYEICINTKYGNAYRRFKSNKHMHSKDMMIAEALDLKIISNNEKDSILYAQEILTKKVSE